VSRVSVCLCGPDGAGKTTILNIVRVYLIRRGLRVYYVWMRGTHTIASLLARFLVRFSLFRGSDIPHYNLHVPCRMRRFWATLEAISAILYLIPRVLKSRLKRTDILLSDRCLIDTAVWVCSTLGISYTLQTFPIKLLLAANRKLFKRTIYVTATIPVLLRRKREYSVKFVLLQVTLYRVFSRYLNCEIIDTSRETVSRSALRLLSAMRGLT